jgi:hypothetical protein
MSLRAVSHAAPSQKTFTAKRAKRAKKSFVHKKNLCALRALCG